MSSVLVRHRRAVIVGGIAVSVAEIAAVPFAPGPAYVTCAAIGLSLFALAIADAWRHRRAPAAFVVDEHRRTFRTPRHANGFLLALAAGQMLVAFAGATGWMAVHGTFFWPGPAGVLIVGMLLAVQAAATWRGYGLTLRSDGIHAEKGIGSLSIPWAALAADRPRRGDQASELKLTYLRPELVTSTGWTPARDEITFEGIDGEFVASAIQTYATEPARRPAIGTAAEHELLRADAPEPAKRRPAEPATPGRTAARTVVGLVLFLGGVTLKTVLDDPHPYLAKIGILPSIAGLSLLGRAFSGWRAVRRQARAGAVPQPSDGTSRPAGPPGGS